MTRTQLITTGISAFIFISLGASTVSAENSGPGKNGFDPNRRQDKAVMQQAPANVGGMEGTKVMERMQKEQQVSGDIKTRTQQELQRRIEKVTKALEKVSNSDSLSAEEKAKMTAELQKELTNLQAIATKVNASTDPMAIKQEVQTLKQSHGEYSLHGPKTSLMHSAEKMVKLADKMASLGTKLDTKLDALEANGQDVSAQRTLLTSLNAKAASAKAKAQTAITTISSLSADGSEANKTALVNAKTSLKAAQLEIKGAHEDMKNILKSLPKTGTPTPSVSASE